jgi:protein-tyrosine phosphatase
MFERLLVICDGNVCRSPTAAAMFQRRLSEMGRSLVVDSAGLVGLEGHPMDDTAREVALSFGLVVPPHEGKVLTAALCSEFDLLLVMEDHQRERLIRRYPQASGKTFKLTHWSGGQNIPDPFRRSRETHERIYPMIESAVESWLEKL